MILEPKKIKSVTVSIVSPYVCHEVMGLNAMILVFEMLSLRPAFSLSFFIFIKRLFSSSLLSAIRVVAVIKSDQNVNHQKATNSKCWLGCEEKRTLLHWWW